MRFSDNCLVSSNLGDADRSDERDGDGEGTDK